MMVYQTVEKLAMMTDESLVSMMAALKVESKAESRVDH
jgi:hypothetical protein